MSAPPGAAVVLGAALPSAERYAALLTGPGVQRGLVGPAEAPRIWERHILNCAVVAELLPPRCVLADLGSGAGLPGIVLAMLRPESEVLLVEPLARRVAFLTECAADLGLEHVRIVRGRAEDLAGEIQADVVTARAVAPLTRLAGWAVGLCRPGGTVLAIKGASAEAEVAASGATLRQLGVQDLAVLQVGSGNVDPPATVVRFRTPPQPRGSARRARGPGAAGGGQKHSGPGSSASRADRAARRGPAGGRKSGDGPAGGRHSGPRGSRGNG